MTTTKETSLFKLQTVAILVAMAGWGWIAGNFAASFDPLWVGVVTTIGHFLPIVLLLIFGFQFFSAFAMHQNGVATSNWGRVGITVLAILAILGSIVMIVLGASNSNPNAVGVKSPSDFIAVIVLNIGGLLWLATLLFSRQRATETARQRAFQRINPV